MQYCHDKVQIVRFPAVVELKRVVHFAGATPEIPGHHIPSSAVERFGHAKHIPACAVSFEAVRQNGHTPGTDARAGGDMIYVDEVAVRGLEAFAPERRQGRTAEQTRARWSVSDHSANHMGALRRTKMIDDGHRLPLRSYMIVPCCTPCRAICPPGSDSRVRP